jgi:cholesterol transport system auxiliary component
MAIPFNSLRANQMNKQYLRHARTCIFILLILIGLQGCAVNLNSNKYTLSGSGTRPHGCHCAYTLFVAEPTASPGYDTDQLIYLKCPYTLKAYSQNQWIAPPHEMLTPLIAQNLRNTCFFRAVVTAPFAGEAQYRLETHLLKLQQEFFTPISRVRMVLHAIVIDNHCRHAIGDSVFTAVIPAPQNNPYSGVIAANKATEIILEKVAGFVICAIQAHPHQARMPSSKEGETKRGEHG